MQVGARINRDQTISKDLMLWNQQGSQVLRGQILVLPVGNRLIYTDTYDEALAQLSTGARRQWPRRAPGIGCFRR